MHEFFADKGTANVKHAMDIGVTAGWGASIMGWIEGFIPHSFTELAGFLMVIYWLIRIYERRMFWRDVRHSLSKLRRLWGSHE